MRYEKKHHGCLNCFLLGHIWDETGNYCLKCGLLTYVAEEGHEILRKLSWVKFRFRSEYYDLKAKFVGRCYDPECGKINRIYKYEIGTHDNCSDIPF